MPLVWISLTFILGVLAASLLSLTANLWLGMGLALLFIFIFINLLLSINNPVSQVFSRLQIDRSSFILHPLPFILPIVFFFGGWWYQFRQPVIDSFHVAFYNDRTYEVLVTGTLADAPDYRDTYTNLQIQVEAVDSGSGDLTAHGLLLVRVPALETYQYGQRVRVRGLLQTPPENEEFSYRDYLARQGIHSYMSKSEVTILPGNGGNRFFVHKNLTKNG